MSSESLTIRLEPDERRCKRCNRHLKVQKTRRLSITTLTGKTDLVIVTRHCPDHKDHVYRPKNTLYPPKSDYGYDVIVEAGHLRHLESKQIQEISDSFKARGIDIPERTIQWLCDRFLHFMLAVHWESLPDIARMFKKRGGYVLHIDGSGNRGPMILHLLDGWSGIRLLAVPVPSEAAKNVIPYLRILKQHLGDPVAIIRDMSKGLESAVAEVFPDVYVIICHYHFLMCVARALFEPLYPRFRNRVDRLGVKKRLRELRGVMRRKRKKTDDVDLTLKIIGDILDYEKDGNGLAYPFSLPAVNFYRRCREASKIVRAAILDSAKRNVHLPFMCRLEDVLRRLQPPPPVLGRLSADCKDIERRWDWFKMIRRALRYRNGPIPLNTDIRLTDSDLEKGRVKLDRVLEKIEKFNGNKGGDRHDRELRRALRRVGKMINEHRDELLAPNVIVESNGREVVRKLPRTNHPEEAGFRMARRHSRRIRGNGDVEPQFQRDGPGILMAQNLKNREYVRMVYGSLDQMAMRFSRVSPESLATVKSFMGNSMGLSTRRNP